MTPDDTPEPPEPPAMPVVTPGRPQLTPWQPSAEGDTTPRTRPERLCLAAAETMRDRGADYGPTTTCFETAAQLASLKLRRSVSPYDVAVVLGCVKEARLAHNPGHADSHVDRVAYAAIAASLAPPPPPVPAG